MSLVASQNISSTSLATENTIASYTATADGWYWFHPRLTGLNGAAATLTFRVDLTVGVDTYEASRGSWSKATAASTRQQPSPIGPVWMNSGETATLKAVSSNASDTAVTGVVYVLDWNNAEVTAVKAKTDQLTFSSGGFVNANVVVMEQDGGGYSPATQIADAWAAMDYTAFNGGTTFGLAMRQCGEQLDAAVSTRAVAGDAMTLTGDYDAAMTAASAASVAGIPTTPLLTNDARLDRLDVAVSTRASQSSVDALPNAIGGTEAVELHAVSDEAVDLVGAVLTIRSGGVVIARYTTLAGGLVTASLNDGEYEVTPSLNGYQASPTTITVDADHTGFDIEMTATPAIEPPDDPDFTTVYFKLIDEAGTAQASTEVDYRMTAAAAGTTGLSFIGATKNVTSDVDGVVSFSVPRGATFVVSIDGSKLFEATAGNDATFAMPAVTVPGSGVNT